MSKIKYSFEDLEVWQKAMAFTKTVIDIIDKTNTTRRHYKLIEQLESAAASIALNIAEGKGRHSKKEFIQFLYIARGSLFEVVTLMILFHMQHWIDDFQLEKIKSLGDEVGKMVSGLINSIKNTAY